MLWRNGECGDFETSQQQGRAGEKIRRLFSSHSFPSWHIQLFNLQSRSSWDPVRWTATFRRPCKARLLKTACAAPSSELLDRKRSRSIQLSRLKGSSTRRSSPDSGAQAKRMEFAVETGSRSSLFAVDQAAATAERLPRRADKAPVTCDIETASASREVQPRRGSGPEMH